ncbi:hypothetical protein LZ30DRAFT_704879 [Colletotrichum cereale]|nr:hypothetical protein LZ30DRAFT_704879 [Colletotrichum cereale]
MAWPQARLPAGCEPPRRSLDEGAPSCPWQPAIRLASRYACMMYACTLGIGASVPEKKKRKEASRTHGPNGRERAWPPNRPEPWSPGTPSVLGIHFVTTTYVFEMKGNEMTRAIQPLSDATKMVNLLANMKRRPGGWTQSRIRHATSRSVSCGNGARRATSRCNYIRAAQFVPQRGPRNNMKPPA